MVIRHGILLIAFVALALLGSCQDVPVDDDSAVVINQKDSVPVTKRDSCIDCVPSQPRPPLRMLTFFFKKDGGRRDSVEFDVSGQTSPFRVERQPDGSLSLSFQLDLRFPQLAKEGSPSYWGIRSLQVNIPEALFDAQGNGKEVAVIGNPFIEDDSMVPGVGVLYHFYNKFNKPYELPFATGDTAWVPQRVVSRGTFQITKVNFQRRLIDAHLDAKLYFPDHVFQWVPGEPPAEIEVLQLDLDFRFGYTE